MLPFIPFHLEFDAFRQARKVGELSVLGILLNGIICDNQRIAEWQK
ncbi:hypothetical protein NIES2098_47210 [Calothrix sp. NIES-2098]|nr:hypothetical protein NIES2098_47210 [Calothrix sp. NIES-2098]